VNALFQTVFSSAASVAFVVLALALMAGVVVVSVRRSRRLSDKATRLLYLALEGRADEARIQARGESRELRPVLDALGGELTPPSTRPLVLDAAAIAAILVFPAGLVLYGLGVLMRAEAASKVPAATALLIGIAVLLPLTLASAATVLEMSRRSARTIRGACVTLLAKSVKKSVDAELSEALRRGANIRDPRGE
jgi:hypothetical protein